MSRWHVPAVFVFMTTRTARRRKRERARVTLHQCFSIIRFSNDALVLVARTRSFKWMARAGVVFVFVGGQIFALPYMQHDVHTYILSHVLDRMRSARSEYLRGTLPERC